MGWSRLPLVLCWQTGIFWISFRLKKKKKQIPRAKTFDSPARPPATPLLQLFRSLTRQTHFGVVNAVGHQHQHADALGVRLFAGQITCGLLVLDGAAEWCDPAAGLKVERRARPHQIVGGRAVAQTQLLTFLQHPERRRRVTHLQRSPGKATGQRLSASGTWRGDC